MTTGEVEDYLKHSPGVILPVGSLEQHGPIGLIGTDALCAERIATLVGGTVDAIVAPTLCYTPAQFNMSFSGTVSVAAKVFLSYFEAIIKSFGEQGFQRVYVLNAHGANLAPMQAAMHDIYSEMGIKAPLLRIKSWWDFDEVNALRTELYGEREGLHATPSEVAITQYTDRIVKNELPSAYRAVSSQFIRDHSGDKHDPAVLHRAHFPDGQVGSDSALATPEHGELLLKAAAESVAKDYLAFVHA